MIGTPHYMAPDVLLGHGYNKEVDLWSLGVISFELVCGMLPFGQDSEDVTEVVKAVLQQNLAFPQRFRTRPFSAQEEELIEGLLCRDPEKRLGAGVNGYDDVKGAEFFSIGGDNTSTLFDKLMGRELDPPLVPDGEVYCDDAGNLDDIAAELSDTDALAP
jgi:cGMP-dependent protein kinase